MPILAMGMAIPTFPPAMSKNLCGYCGRISGTNAPFPKKEIDGAWMSVVCPKCYSLEHIKLLSHKRTNDNEFKETLIAQREADKKRKMVGNGLIDLVFWFDEDDSIFGFQYNLRESDYAETSFTWSKEYGSKFRKVYTGRRQFGTNQLVNADVFPKDRYIQIFEESSTNLKPEYRDLVLGKLKEYDFRKIGL